MLRRVTALSRRPFSSSAIRRDNVSTSPDEEGSGSPKASGPQNEDGSNTRNMGMETWKTTLGRSLRLAKPRACIIPKKNTRGGYIYRPFPMNKSFIPPVPTSDWLKTHIFNEYMTDPINCNPRFLARKHTLGIKRVEAILRLKGMEADYKKVSLGSVAFSLS